MACSGAFTPVQPCHGTRAVLKGKERGFVTQTETNAHGDALCFMVKTWAIHKATETALNNGWWRLAVGGGGLRLSVDGGWQLVAGGGWRLAVGGGWRWMAVGS